ncbi:flavin reductase family protein [Caulobacter sp. 17J65-9]|uniref:flavin reductase n=1 Tax=Caulobacter sp. 17J65-9 TaxID=2709382 RepID=UPI0013C5E51B|nr:flavin reductase family protein [Caulobacter sp. 17J65-9]
MDSETSLSFRRALGTFATGVAVITAEDQAGALGLTVNSFTSVSLEPPLVLWCLGDESDRRHVFHTAERFAVNVLATEDQAHSERFAFGACRLAPDEIERGPEGAPMLAGAMTRFECVTHDRIQMGDHVIIVGRVVAFDSRPGDGLLYFRGRYGRPVGD